MIAESCSLSVARPLIYDVSIQQNAEENGKNKGGKRENPSAKMSVDTTRTAPGGRRVSHAFFEGDWLHVVTNLHQPPLQNYFQEHSRFPLTVKSRKIDLR